MELLWFVAGILLVTAFALAIVNCLLDWMIRVWVDTEDKKRDKNELY